MKTGLLFTVPFIAASLALGAEKDPPALKADTFRFVRTEQKTFPTIVQDGRTVAPSRTVTYGVFVFRYSSPKPLEFFGFGQPAGQRFVTRFTEYRIRKDSRWERYPIFYCGTGTMTYTLQPGADYELLIDIEPPSLSNVAQLRVSADTPDGTFWSEPFAHPKK